VTDENTPTEASYGALKVENQALREACEAAIKYDTAIRKCGDDPDKMASFCTVQGNDLDNLYEDWINKARTALRKRVGLKERLDWAENTFLKALFKNEWKEKEKEKE